MAVWEARPAPPPTALPRRDRRVLHVVGAIAALLLCAGIITRGTVGLSSPPGERIVSVDPVTGEVTSGAELVPGRSLPMFPDVHLVPGEPRSACMELTHSGQVPLDTVALRLDATDGSSLLLEHLRLSIERGGPAGADCTGFVPDVEIVSGLVTDLVAPPTTAGWSSWAPGANERTTYRFTVVLPGDADLEALQGTRARVDFLWAATATSTGEGFGARLLLLSLALARDALLPLLLLAVVAVLFLGVQDRIDRQDPKLALAAVYEEPQRFRTPTTVIDLIDPSSVDQPRTSVRSTVGAVPDSSRRRGRA